MRHLPLDSNEEVDTVPGIGMCKEIGWHRLVISDELILCQPEDPAQYSPRRTG